MEKKAYAVLKRGIVHMQAYARSTAGRNIAYGPAFSCSISDELKLRYNLKKAFEYSIQGIAQPNREGWKEVERPMLEAAGEKTWSAMARGAKALGFKLEDGIVTISPSSNYWNGGGEPLPEEDIVAPVDTPDLGKLIIRAFAISS